MSTPKPCCGLLGALSAALLCAGLLALLTAPPGACAARTLHEATAYAYSSNGGSTVVVVDNQQEQQEQPQPDASAQRSDGQEQGYSAPADNDQRQQAQPADDKQQAAGSGVGDADLQRVLDMHNAFRAKHRAGALSWSGELQSSAQAWAERCVFEHSNSGVGENLAQGFGDWASAVQAWYDEAGQYDYGAATFSHGTGHFSQIVWVGTTSLGCGAARGCGGGPLYVCQYAPPGNVLGQFGDNVFPAQS